MKTLNVLMELAVPVAILATFGTMMLYMRAATVTVTTM